MNETSIRGVLIKSIAIIGFFATIVLIAWLVILGIQKAPGAFASLASVVESMSLYRPATEIVITSEKSVLNSNDSFQITWTDVHRDGEYTFKYACVSGVDILVRDGDGNFVPMSCTDTLTLPSNVHGLFLSVISDEMRFTDIVLSVSFSEKDTEETLANEVKVTVVNATLPTTEGTMTEGTIKTEEVAVVPESVPESKPVAEEESLTVSTPVSKPVLKPITVMVYPQSDPNGVVDLKMTTVGIGVLENGVFEYASKYDRDLQNAIKFDIRNVGTKTSEPWAFITILPDGSTYSSEPQLGLMPNEHAEFTLGFRIGEDTKAKLVEIKNTVYTSVDINKKNNSSTWSVVLKN